MFQCLGLECRSLNRGTHVLYAYSSIVRTVGCKQWFLLTHIESSCTKTQWVTILGKKKNIFIGFGTQQTTAAPNWQRSKSSIVCYFVYPFRIAVECAFVVVDFNDRIAKRISATDQMQSTCTRKFDKNASSATFQFWFFLSIRMIRGGEFTFYSRFGSFQCKSRTYSIVSIRNW